MEIHTEHQLGERQANVLAAVIREYIKSAEPVGSHTLVQSYRITASPATVRNDMVALEVEGYLTSPHTSAGRVPTEKGYQYYIQHFLSPHPLPKREQQEIRSQWENADRSTGLRNTAKAIADFSTESVFLSFGKDDIFYTGLANLFQHPEFQMSERLSDIGNMVDHLQETIAEVFDELPAEITVLIGSDSPFGRNCSVVVRRYNAPGLGQGLFGILGPTRMDYDSNVARVRFVHELLSNQE